MRHIVPITIATLALVACGGSRTANSPAPGAQAQPASGASADTAAQASAESTAEDAAGGASNEGNEFVLRNSESAKEAHGRTPSKIKGTRTEAALKFTVLDKDKGPIQGVVISLTAPDGKTYYTEETNEEGYAELLVPIGQKYDIVYLSLGRRDITASVSVTDEPNQNLRLTLRYKRFVPPPAEAAAPEPRFVLDGIYFDVGKATIRADSFSRLDSVVEYMTYKKSSRIEISGHTDNVGNPKVNKALSEKRAHACRDYLISKGIDKSRIEAIGYGDQRPIGPNDTEEGREKNRRIEAREL